MPELPDVIAYTEALRARIVDGPIEAVHLRSPFVLRSVDPPLEVIRGQAVRAVRHIGKRIVLELPDAVFLVIHLMVAGRLRWREPEQGPGVGGRLLLAVIEFGHGRLLFTEAGLTKRALTWIARLRAEYAGRFPERVTACRDGMAVHGRFRQPCPVCGAPVQRLVYADHECHYCARCQTGGRVLADRALSRLLGADWPRHLDG